MANIASDKIIVFPSAKRANGNPNYVKASRALSEQNLIGLVNQLLEVKSFVISNEWDAEKDFQFNIGGYLFTIKAGGYDITDNNIIDVYAQISTSIENNYIELNGDDISISGKYSGLELIELTTSPSDPIINDATHLHILTKVGNNYVIPEESKLNLIDQTIDGGEIGII